MASDDPCRSVSDVKALDLVPSRLACFSRLLSVDLTASWRLVAHDQERIIIPTAYRTDYLGALRAFSHNGHTDPLIRMLDVAQSYTQQIDWATLEQARAALTATNAFDGAADGKLKLR